MPNKIRCQKCTDRMKKNSKKRIASYIKNNCCARCGRDKSRVDPWPYRDCAGCQLRFKFSFLGTKDEAEDMINRILVDQDFKCALTGRCLKKHKYHIDHISPKSLGGGDSELNLQLIVDEANIFKSNITMDAIISLAHDIVKHNNTTNTISSSDVTTGVSSPNDCYDDEIIVYNGNKLTSEYIKSVPVEEREEIALALLEFFSKRDFSKPIMDEKKIDRDWKRLKENNIQIVDNTISISPNTGNRIYKHFFPNILKISTKTGRSVCDVLGDKKLLLKVIRNRLGIGYKEIFNIRPNMIKQGAKSTGLAAHGSQFKPLIAKAIYNMYVKDGDNVLDYSCGFGSRLLGLMATGKNVKYFGFEPSTETYKNLLNLSSHFGFNVDIKNCGSETESFNDKMNFVFSSPPYFDHEIYCDENTQCYNGYPDYDDWLEKYWKKTITNIRGMMASGAVFGINIGNNSNEKMIRIANDVLEITEQCGFSRIDTIVMRNPISHLANKANKKKKFKEDYIYLYAVT